MRGGRLLAAGAKGKAAVREKSDIKYGPHAQYDGVGAEASPVILASEAAESPCATAATRSVGGMCGFSSASKQGSAVVGLYSPTHAATRPILTAHSSYCMGRFSSIK